MKSDAASTPKEGRTFRAPKALSETAHLKTEAEYEALYRRSVSDPAGFWAQQAEENIVWFKKWTEVFRHDFSSIGREEKPYVEYFVGAKLNASYNCLDRHVESGRRDDIAVIWHGDREGERRTLTYGDLHAAVCRVANVLKHRGVRKGSVVTIYMPMVPEAAVAMLACARIGAVHSVVFSAFSSDSLRNRIQDCGSEFLITADAGSYSGKTVPLKAKADEALAACPGVKHVLVLDRAHTQVPMKPGRDLWWHEEVAAPYASAPSEPAVMDAEDPLFILYTSGSTGKPKGVLHTTGGYLLQAHLTFKWIFDARPGQLHWCTADVGWVTGHSYVVYGPLSNGVTVLMFEGVPTWPEPDRFWKIIDAEKVNIFYTAPTAIRALARLGDTWPAKYKLDSLRVLGSVGEPINPEAWMWYYRTIGREKCPVMDTWWQTETGGIMITPLAAAVPMKPGSASKPFFGVVPEVRRIDGSPADTGESGSLVITRPWPGMIRGVWGDKKHELIKKVYFSDFPGVYFTGDGCRIDADGFYWLLGRIDDVINVSAHRFSTAEIESALVGYSGVAEAAVVGFPHDIKGQGIYCFVTLKESETPTPELERKLVEQVRKEIGPIATPDRIQFAPALPKTRSGKIMRRILRKIAEGDIASIGDTSTLADPAVVDTLVKGRK